MAYHSTTLEYKQAYANAKHSFFGDTLPSLLQSSPRKFWSIVNGPKNKNLKLCNNLGSVIPSDRCSEALQDVFKNAFSTDHSNDLPFMVESNLSIMDSMVTDQLGIFNLILKMKTSAPGTDGITKFLKHLFIVRLFFRSFFHSHYNMLHCPTIGRRGR